MEMVMGTVKLNVIKKKMAELLHLAMRKTIKKNDC
jgi:hypothetical protein